MGSRPRERVLRGHSVWLLLLVGVCILPACEQKLGTPFGHAVSGHVFYEGASQQELQDPVVRVALRGEDLQVNLYPLVIVDAPTEWPEAGVPFRIDFVDPGRYRIDASMVDRFELRAPVARAYLAECREALETGGSVLEIKDAPIADVHIEMHDVSAPQEVCPGALADGASTGDGGVGDGSAEETDPFADYGLPCDAGEDRSDRGFTSPDCSESAPYCAALPSQSSGFCTQSGCDLPGVECPPGWTCFDPSALVPGAAHICIDPALFS